MKTPPFFTILLLLAASPAFAFLGGSASTVESDRVATASVKGETQVFPNYEIHEIQSGSNVIREYLSSSGVVFGIAWSGRAHPDLKKILGNYLSDYQTASSQTPREKGRKPRLIQGDHVVVKTWGHMRNFRGHAYDPSLFPTGVSANDIQ